MSSKHPGLARWRRRSWGFTILVTLFWLSLLAVPDFALGVTLDESWEQGLGILFERGAQAGKDYVFTYGPLGYFLTSAYEPGLFWPRLGWELTVKLAMAWIFASLLWRLRSMPLRLFFAAIVLAFLGPDDRSVRDATSVTAMLCLTLLALDRPVRSRAGLFYLLALVVLSHIKHTILMLAVFYLVVRSIAFARSGRWTEALAAPALFVVVWLSAWLSLGQSLAYLPRYLEGSWQLTVGYAQAMAIDSPDRVREIELAIASLVALSALWFTLAPRRRRHPRMMALAVVLAGTLFFQWKEGFTRHDGLHARVFFVSALAMMCAGLARLRPARRRMARLLGAIVAACCLVGISASTYPPHQLGRLLARNLWAPVHHAQQVLMPLRLRHELDARRADVPSDWQLPKTRQAVGAAPIDLFTNFQGYLFANDLNWRPRPVFQSYIAYTPFLRDLNANFLRSSIAPEYLLLAPTTIDQRLPSTEDGPALLVALHRYRPTLIEKGFLLVHREDGHSPAPVPAPGPIRLDRTARMGEWLSLADISDSYQVLSIDVRPTLGGRLLSFVYHPEALSLIVRTADGQDRTYRLVPGTAQNFLINPLLADGMNLRNLLYLYGLPGAPKAVALRVTGLHGSPSGYEPEVHFSLRACPPPPFPRLSESDIGRLLGP